MQLQMQVQVRNQRDFVVGLLYVAAGAGFSFAASRHEMGTLAQIGPGFFPFWLGVLLAGLGVAVGLRAAARLAPRVALEAWDLRSLGWMVGSVLLFALTLKPLGLVLALLLLVVASSLASPEFRWRATLLNAAVLIAVNVGGFVHGLSLPLQVWPAFMTH